MNEIAEMLRQLEAGRFYGSVEMKFEAGHIVLLKKTETIKPMQPSCGDNRGTHERNQSR